MAQANAGDDEANRQRMMADMRANAAAADRRNQDSIASSQAASARYAERTGSSGIGTNGGASGGSGWAAPATYQPSGPRSIVAEYNFTIRRQEAPGAALARLLQEAATGNTQSAFNAGRMLYSGYGGVARNDAAAREQFMKAAAAGHVAAQAQYGYMLHEGIGGPVNAVEGDRLLKVAADGDDSYGAANYGLNRLKQGHRTGSADLGEAVAYLQKAADSGSVIGQATLGTLVYQQGVGATQDWAKAEQFTRLAAEQGEPLAIRELGRMYLSGRGVAKDPAQGLALLNKAATAGDGQAMGFLAQFALSGEFGSRDVAKGAEWMRKGAEAGDPGSMANYAVLLMTGQGVTKDLSTGARWALKAAELGEVHGQTAIAKAYYFGEGVPKDMVQSASWFRKAAAQGDTEAIEAMKDEEIVRVSGGK